MLKQRFLILFLFAIPNTFAGQSSMQASSRRVVTTRFPKFLEGSLIIQRSPERLLHEASILVSQVFDAAQRLKGMFEKISSLNKNFDKLMENYSIFKTHFNLAEKYLGFAEREKDADQQDFNLYCVTAIFHANHALQCEKYLQTIK